MPRTAPYGAWKSRVTFDRMASAGVGMGLAEVQVGAAGIHWLERRPAEGGRNTVMQRSASGAIRDVLGEGWNARTLVHEYGGGSYAAVGATVYFAHFDDQRVYRCEDGAEPVPITPAPGRPRGLRWSDFAPAPDGRWLYCVRETHTEGAEARNEIVALRTDGSGDAVVLAGGADFVSFPRPSPDGRRLAWTRWHHPRMPWEGTELWLAEVTGGGGIRNARRLAGGAEESIYQPAFAPDGTLHFVSDTSGWWNLYRWRDGEAEPLAPMSAEFGRPQWMFGGGTYGFLDDGRIVCIWSAGGIDHLGVLDPEAKRLTPLDTPFTAFGHGPPRPVDGGARVALVAASPREEPALVLIDTASGAVEVVKRERDDPLDPRYLSEPEALEFPSAEERSAHALYYPPHNPDFEAPAGTLPPLVVMSHGGPTAATSSAFRAEVQFWTSRGIAVVDVNYGGSTGYGREYRRRLEGAWGIVDTEDCIAAARHLVALGRVDGDRLAIRGRSAGGYTTLCALTFHDVFAAGASYFGVADAESLARDTHKFESRYLDSLIGPWPEARERYRERSPIHFTDRLSCPVLLLQGLEDEIVPPSQAEVMAEALRRRGLPHAYVAFEGEQHGFRRAETLRRAAEAELYFYGRVFGFEPADPIEPIPIENADRLPPPAEDRAG